MEYLEDLTPTELILVFIKNLGLADHLGDVANEVVWLLKALHIDIEYWDDLSELADILGKMGVKYWFEYKVKSKE